MRSLPIGMDRPFIGDFPLTLIPNGARRFLTMLWPDRHAVEMAERPEEVAKIWSAFARQGWTETGADHDDDALSSAVVVMQELGRVACPVPLTDAFLPNVALPAAPSVAATDFNACRSDRGGAAARRRDCAPGRDRLCAGAPSGDAESLRERTDGTLGGDCARSARTGTSLRPGPDAALIARRFEYAVRDGLQYTIGGRHQRDSAQLDCNARTEPAAMPNDAQREGE
jgi:hypothetical protein